MAVVDLAPSTEDGRIYITTNDSSGGWAASRNATSGTQIAKTSTSITNAVSVFTNASRAGGSDHGFSRTFFHFDTSRYSAADGTLTAPSLRVYGQTYGVADLFVVKATQSDTMVVGDIDAIEGWAGATADGSGGGDESGNVTYYSVLKTTWSTTGYNIMILNPAAAVDILALDDFKVCLIEADYDLKDVAPTGFTVRTGIRFMESSASYRPFLRFNWTEYAQNATFFGTNF